MSITIQGYSDDIISISGDIEDEYPVQEETNFIAISDGTVVEVSYDGIWKIVLRAAGTGKFIQDYNAVYDTDKNYSDIVTIEGDIKWVAPTNYLMKV